MSKKLTAAQQLEGLLDGLEDLVLAAQAPDAVPARERADLAESMRLVLAASTARANLDAKPGTARPSRPRATPAVKLRELRALLNPPSLLGMQASAVFEGDDSDQAGLGFLIDDIERIIANKHQTK